MGPRQRPVGSLAVDALLVLTAAGGAVDVVLRRNAEQAPDAPLWFVIVAVVSLPLLLLGRHRHPFAAPASVWLAAGAISFVDGRIVVFAIGATVAGLASAYLLGSLADRGESLIGLAVVVASTVVVVYHDPGRTPGDLVFIPLMFAIGWLAGYAVRRRSAEASAARARAERAELERDAAARIAVAEERSRIARELHDVVAHAVSVIVLQVGAVRHRLPAELVEDADALRDVEGVGRAALAEMRRLLSALRDEADQRDLAPQPGLDRLDALFDDVRRAGLDVAMRVEGAPYPLSRALELSVYRIVQEGLTNVLKHARATRAAVTLGYTSEGVRIEVRDDGTGPATAASRGGGHGLVGIRERVKIYRGEMSAGAAPDGGYVLSARLPVGVGS